MTTLDNIVDRSRLVLDDEAPTVALVSYDSLGDGLIYLMIAENLRLNGYQVTYYGSRIAQLSEWFPQLSIEPYPKKDCVEEQLSQFDLVLYSPPSFVRHQATDAEMRRLAERYVIVCLSRHVRESWRVDHADRILKSLPSAKSRRLLALASCSGSIRHRKFSRESMVQIALSFMTEKMRLPKVTANVQLHAPPGLEHRRYRNRVVICPDSAVPERKDWTPRRILGLAARLRSRGLDPKIVASPDNIDKWQRLAADVCETPALHGIDALAAYLYESGAVVASDSGGGHLASFLGIPTVTIHRRTNRKFAWRPGWGPGVVVCPVMTLSILKTHVWRPFVPTRKIVAAVETFCSPAADPALKRRPARSDLK